MKLVDYHGRQCWVDYQDKQMINLTGIAGGLRYNYRQMYVGEIKYSCDNFKLGYVSFQLYFRLGLSKQDACQSDSQHLRRITPPQRYVRPDNLDNGFHAYSSNLRRKYDEKHPDARRANIVQGSNPDYSSRHPRKRPYSYWSAILLKNEHDWLRNKFNQIREDNTLTPQLKIKKFGEIERDCKELNAYEKLREM